MKTTLLMPVYDDWSACRGVLQALDAVLNDAGRQARVLLIDDGSTTPPGADFGLGPFRALNEISILHLKRNLGHQRALCVGLASLDDARVGDAIVVMDADGEDAPADVPRLLNAFEEAGGTAFVFAERTRRSERWLFRFFYQLYRLLHRLLLGFDVKIGNFSVVPASRLPALLVVPELWNHYAAAVVVSRQPILRVSTERAKRIDGQATMNFSALVAHGLSAISVFSGIVGVRLLVGVTVLIVLVMVALIALAFAGSMIGPGWMGGLLVLLLVALLQALTLGLCFSALILSGRTGATFLPVRDAAYLIDTTETLYRA